jgi:hypothetical protein
MTDPTSTDLLVGGGIIRLPVALSAARELQPPAWVRSPH